MEVIYLILALNISHLVARPGIFQIVFYKSYNNNKSTYNFKRTKRTHESVNLSVN